MKLTKIRRLFLYAIPVVGIALAMPFSAFAKSGWPGKPITFIVPGAAGGTTDMPARIIAQKLGERLGQNVVVENITGAGGIIGVQNLMRRPADGYTVFIGNTGTQAINFSAYKNLDYKSEDFLPLTDMILFANVLQVNARSNIKTVEDLVAELKRKPGKLSFSSAGVGQTTHLTSELFLEHTGTSAMHIPYRGSAPATMALLSDDVDFMFDNFNNALPQIQGGKVRALAVTSDKRMPKLPDIPTMAQAGLEDFVVTVFLGFFVRAETSPEIASKLSENLIAVLKAPDVVAQFQSMGGVPGGSSPDRFAEFVESERIKWTKLIL